LPVSLNRVEKYVLYYIEVCARTYNLLIYIAGRILISEANFYEMIKLYEHFIVLRKNEYKSFR